MITNLILSLLLAAVVQPRATVNLNPVEQANVTRTHDQIALTLAPSAKQKLQRVAQSLADAPNVENAVHLGIHNAFPGVNFSQNDLDALTVFVLSEAVTSLDKEANTTSKMTSRSQSMMDRRSKLLGTQRKLGQISHEMRKTIINNLR
jgi:hypothetical protein